MECTHTSSCAFVLNNASLIPHLQGKKGEVGDRGFPGERGPSAVPNLTLNGSRPKAEAGEAGEGGEGGAKGLGGCKGVCRVIPMKGMKGEKGSMVSAN